MKKQAVNKTHALCFCFILGGYERGKEELITNINRDLTGGEKKMEKFPSTVWNNQGWTLVMDKP